MVVGAGRFRGRVLGLAVLVTLLQFLVNVVGQLWDDGRWLRPFTVFYYYQPQQIIRATALVDGPGGVWNGGQPLFAVNVLAVLVTVGSVGYALALWTFCRRDLPAPLRPPLANPRGFSHFFLYGAGDSGYAL